MTIPDGMLTVRLSIHSILPEGSGRNGVVIFTPNTLLTSEDFTTMISGEAAVVLGGGGSAYVTLIACDEPSIVPVDWKYYVFEIYDGVFFRGYAIQPTSADDGKDLAEIDHVT